MFKKKRFPQGLGNQTAFSPSFSEVGSAIPFTAFVLIGWVLLLFYLYPYLFNRSTLIYSVIVIGYFLWLVNAMRKEIQAYMAERRGLKALCENPDAFFQVLSGETGMDAPHSNGNLVEVEVLEAERRKDLSVSKVSRVLQSFWGNSFNGVSPPENRPWFCAVRISDVLVRADSGLSLEPQALSSDIEPYLNHSHRRFDTFLEVTLIVGLCGTILGMLHIFLSSSFSRVDLTISQFLGGLKEAMGSTLIAIVTSIAARIMYHDVSNHQMNLANELDEFTKAHLIPRYQRAKETVRVQVDLNDVTANVLSEKIKEGLVTGVREEMKHFLEGSKAFILSAVNEVKTAINEVKNLQEQLVTLNKAILEGSTTVVRSIELLKDTSAALKLTVEAMHREVQEWGLPVTALHQQIGALKMTLDAWTASLERVDGALSGWGDSSARALTRCETTLEELTKQMNTTLAQVSEAMMKTQEMCQKTTAMATDAIEQMKPPRLGQRLRK